MKKKDLIECICEFDRTSKKHTLRRYSEEKLRKYLDRLVKLNMERTEIQCSSVFS